MRGQPLDQRIHFRDGFRDRGQILFAPASDLAFKIVAGLAIVAQANSDRVYLVEFSQHPVHFQVSAPPLCRCHVWQGLVPIDLARHVGHDVERPPDYRFVLTQDVHVGNWYCGLTQRRHHPVFALDGVCRGQQLGHWSRFCPHHIGTVWCGEFVCGVGLAAFEHLHTEWTFEAG